MCSRWERPLLSTKPHSLVPGWVSAESLSGEQRAPQSHCWVWPAAALQDPGMAPGLSSRWSPERTLPAGAATTGVLLPWDGVVQASQVARTPLVPTPVLCRPPISVALGWGSLRGVEPHALRGGTFAASVSVASQPPPAEGLPLSTSPPSYQSAWLPLCSLVHCFRSARLQLVCRLTCRLVWMWFRAGSRWRSVQILCSHLGIKMTSFYSLMYLYC